VTRGGEIPSDGNISVSPRMIAFIAHGDYDTGVFALQPDQAR
jgi:hypothetical protein